jgi:predicted MPP superfamily phosphohydrolase
LSKFAIFLGALPFVTMSYGIIRNRHRYNVIRETITLKNLPKALDGLRIVQFSDVHSGSFTDTEPVKKAIELINAQNPDLVFFTGDLVNTKADEMDDYLTVFDKIKAKIGIFSVTGNHDYGDYGRWDSSEEKIANFERLKGHHKTLGWDLLMNENRILEINGEKLAIIGVENYSGKPQFSKYGKLDKAYEGTQNVPVKLLLSHDPTHWEAQILNYKDIDITFSGHTHGTQFGIEIPGLRWSPAQYIYKQWAGLYQEGQQYLYVNRGLGYLGYPGRVGILPEITVIELKA